MVSERVPEAMMAMRRCFETSPVLSSCLSLSGGRQRNARSHAPPSLFAQPVYAENFAGEKENRRNAR